MHVVNYKQQQNDNPFWKPIDFYLQNVNITDQSTDLPDHE